MVRPDLGGADGLAGRSRRRPRRCSTAPASGRCAPAATCARSTTAGRRDRALARAFWSEEYRLNALIGRYPKPYVAIQDGIVMGGGIGLSGHARHRIVTERSRLAMPETGIGLIPDVGGTWLLARCARRDRHLPGPDRRGDGRGRRDLCPLRRRVRSLGQARRSWSSGWWTPRAGRSGTPSRRWPRIPGRHRLPTRRADIDRVFGGATVEAMLEALAGHAGRVGAEDRRGAGAEIAEVAEAHAGGHSQCAHARARSRRRSTWSIRLCVRLFEDGEFPEGVRALIVDKDRKPKWSPARLADVRPELVAAYLAPLPASEELGLTPPKSRLVTRCAANRYHRA